jgi:galactokinase
MAITSDVLLAVSVHPPSSSDQQPSTIQLINILPDKFPSRDFSLPRTDEDIPIDATAHEWTNYFKSGLLGATRHLRTHLPNFTQSVGLSVLCDGSVPAGGGLSSSAAFTCASTLAVLRANNVGAVSKKDLVELAIVSERAVGVNSGGMDQAASVFPRRGEALMVSFVPELEARGVGFPEGVPLTFVVAQSFVQADKFVTGPECYNLRVVEVTLAALVLARVFGIEGFEGKSDAGPLGVSLRGFHDAYFQQKEGIPDNHAVSQEIFQRQLQDLLDKVDSYLPQEEGYTRAQISEILNVPVATLEEKYMTKFPIRAERFKLRQRALHVFGEARRVLQFHDLLMNSPAPQTPAEETKLLTSLGAFLNDTQDSCRDLYENSCPELDELCRLAREAGAHGSRLTGAGWGGCSVHLVPEGKVEAVRRKWTAEYYKKKFPDISEEKLREAMVVSRPGGGSCVVEVKGRERF